MMYFQNMEKTLFVDLDAQSVVSKTDGGDEVATRKSYIECLEKQLVRIGNGDVIDENERNNEHTMEHSVAHIIARIENDKSQTRKVSSSEDTIGIRTDALNILADFLSSECDTIVIHETIPGFDHCVNGCIGWMDGKSLRPYNRRTHGEHVADWIEGFFENFMRFNRCYTKLVKNDNIDNEYFYIFTTSYEGVRRVSEFAYGVYSVTDNEFRKSMMTEVINDISHVYFVKEDAELRPYMRAKKCWREWHKRPFGDTSDILVDSSEGVKNFKEYIYARYCEELRYGNLTSFLPSTCEFLNNAPIATLKELTGIEFYDTDEEIALRPSFYKVAKAFRKHVPLTGNGSDIFNAITMITQFIADMRVAFKFPDVSLYEKFDYLSGEFNRFPSNVKYLSKQTGRMSALLVHSETGLWPLDGGYDYDCDEQNHLHLLHSSNDTTADEENKEPEDSFPSVKKDLPSDTDCENDKDLESDDSGSTVDTEAE
jgi:hypothetical protein